MLRVSKCKLLVRLVVVAILGVGAVNAAPLTIVNPGFETGDLTGWTCLSNNGPGSDGAIAPYSNGAFPGVTGNGNFFCWANWGHLVQNIGTVQADTTYTLTAQVGFPSYVAGAWPWPGGDVRFVSVIDGVATNLAVTMLPSFTTAEAGTLKTVSVTWTSPTSGIPLGSALDIQMWSYAPQVGFDNVSVDVTSLVPEPASILSIMTGLIGLCGVIIRKRN